MRQVKPLLLGVAAAVVLSAGQALADHLGRAVEIMEWIAHRRRLRNLARRLKAISSDNAVGLHSSVFGGKRIWERTSSIPPDLTPQRSV